MISKTMISENMILQIMIMILQIMIVKRKEKHSQMDRAVAMIHGLSTWPAAVHCVYGLRPAAPPAPRAASASNYQKRNKGNHISGSPSLGTQGKRPLQTQGSYGSEY